VCVFVCVCVGVCVCVCVCVCVQSPSRVILPLDSNFLEFLYSRHFKVRVLVKKILSLYCRKLRFDDEMKGGTLAAKISR